MAETNQDQHQDQPQPQEQPEASDYLNIEASAKFLTVHPGTIRKAISQHRLKSTLIYGRVVISRAELNRYRAETYPDGGASRGRPAARDSAPEQEEK